MIRIDEIYNHTFWPWVKQNRSGTRLLFCDPPGSASPDSLFNLSSDSTVENDYIFFHDQEPVQLDEFTPLFDEVLFRNWGLDGELITSKGLLNNNLIEWPDQQFKINFQSWRNKHTQTSFPEEFFKEHYKQFIEFKNHNDKVMNLGHIIVSEKGEYVEQLCNKYGWTPHYYFYHGWACLDWFRGYDRAFLIARARDRNPTQTFMSPNRIVGGRRDHRVLFLYNVFKNQLEHNHISAPRICPEETVDIISIAQKYTNVYQDITDVFDCADLPRTFVGETTQNMTSCWLTNFDEAADSLVYVPTETVYFGRRTHITEKTFKAIALEMPFVLVAPAGSLAYLREYGFKTFADVFDESYDLETDDILRIEKVVDLLKYLDDLTAEQRQAIHQRCLPIVEHNYRHFYSGNFGDVLWTELNGMLDGLKI